MCNHDCFNCKYDDCINNDVTVDEIKKNEEVARSCDRAESRKKQITYQYNQSDKCKAIQAKYDRSEKGKERSKRYEQSEKGKARRKRYENSEKRRARRREKCRERYMKSKLKIIEGAE